MRSKLQLAIWGVLLVAFLGSGSLAWMLQLDRRVDWLGAAQGTQGEFPIRTEWASTEYMLFLAFNAPVRSDAVIDALAQLPQGEAVLFLASSEAEPSFLAYMLTSYLAWPRQVWGAACGAGWRVLPPTSPRLAGVVLYRLEPPSWVAPTDARDGKPAVIPLAEELQWTSFCP